MSCMHVAQLLPDPQHVVCNDCYFVFWVTCILVKVPFGNIKVRADSPEIVMDLLHVAGLVFLNCVLLCRRG